MTEPRKALLERLFAEQGHALRGFLQKRLNRSADPAELAQEVYLRMLRVKDLSTIRSPEAYLFTIAANLAQEHNVKSRASGRSVDINDDAVQEQLAELPSFGQECDAEARGKRLQEVLLELPAKCQAAVALHYWRGMSYEEVGTQLGISSHMVKKYVQRALAHCRRRMARLG
jgi:RNA polymerase sigma-70 factor (ECF subfamily)